MGKGGLREERTACGWEDCMEGEEERGDGPKKEEQHR